MLAETGQSGVGPISVVRFDAAHVSFWRTGDVTPGRLLLGACDEGVNGGVKAGHVAEQKSATMAPA